MSSDYNKVHGTLETGKTARADDIHLIQSSIQDAIQQMIIDMFGTGFILGESENALKLYPTDLHVDQSNLNYNEDLYWVSFYDKYLMQPIDIKKSSIETIRVHMINDSNITTTIYAEIRNSNFDLIEEANAVLKPTPNDDYNEIDFHFDKHHLPIGRYFFIIRPVDISATDLAQSGDEVLYTTSPNRIQAMPDNYTINTSLSDTLLPEHFCVRYDADGNYNQGLHASYDGDVYLKANMLEEHLSIDVDGDTDTENNPDLFFEEIFSSGNTYLIDDEVAAVVLGEKVYPLDTHVTLSEAPENGNRIDLVTLTTEGLLDVTEGNIYTDNEEKNYPTNDAGLSIAYITSYKASTKKVPSIEQDDDNNTTRHRDVIERLRRLEKRMDYQVQNNSPTRIKYNCVVDPILANNGVDEDASIRGEGTYGMSTTTANGSTVATDVSILNYAWSIIKDNYTYNVETEMSTNGKITVWDTYTTSTKNKNYTANKNGLYSHHIEVIDYSKKDKTPVSGLKLKVEVKKGGTLKKTFTVETNKDGKANITFFSLKLAKGTYSVYTIYGEYKIKSKLIVVDDVKDLNGKEEKTHELAVSLPIVSGTSVTHKLPTGVISGNDSFYADNVDVDVENGEVRVKKITDISDTYEINNGRALLKDTKKYKSSEHSYKIISDENAMTSQLPALHITFDREVYIKSLTPYIAGFKNIDSFGILIFKNDIVYNNVKDKRRTYKKKIGAGKINKNNYDDADFPTLYKSEYVSLKDLVKKSGDYQVLKQQVTFNDVNLDLEAGTYTIMLCPKLTSGQDEGEIKIKEYTTHNDVKEYGTCGSCNSNSQISLIYMNTTNLSNKSWDIAIKHKTYRYYDSGILQSKPINTGVAFSACSITKNFIIPKNCDIKLFVSNNGGASWIQAKTNHVKFPADNSSFRWKIEMTTNNISTPKLKFNNTRQNAINFSLATAISYVEYEDFNRCYETPILNANAITRTFTASAAKNSFSEWEFARIFMEDEGLNSKIDILISYAYDNYLTSVNTDKKNWGLDIFYSTVFADLILEDFSQTSIDYDNYEGNVEYDENNYRFGINSNAIIHDSEALASPSDTNSIDGNNEDIYYGDISLNGMGNTFSYDFVNQTASPYVYHGNEEDETQKYSGMHIDNGPYVKATYINNAAPYTSDDSIIGIRFNGGLNVGENATHLTIGLMPHKSTINDNTNIQSGNCFPAGTFAVALSLGRHGEVEKEETVDDEGNISYIDKGTTGKTYIIDKDLISDVYTEIDVNFIEDLEGYDASHINSIAIKAVNPDANPMSNNDFIGIGRVTTSSFNIRPYVSYTYTGSWARFQWKNIITNANAKEKAQAYAMYSLGRLNANTSSDYKVFYPIDNEKDDISVKKRKITSFSENIEGQPINGDSRSNEDNVSTISGPGQLRIWNSDGTNRRIDSARDFSSTNYIQRKENQIYTKISGQGTFVTKDTGNQILFQLPSGALGNLFKINTNIPYTIYDLIDIEYYIFSQYWRPSDSGYNNQLQKADSSGNWNIHKNTTNNNIYYTDGSFSKGEIFIDFYDTTDINNATPIESFALPAWGRVATRSEVKNKIVHSWFKKRSTNTTIRSIVLRRENPRGLAKDKIKSIKLMLNNILFFNTEMEGALGPQMQMRIYPNNVDNMTNTKIRKVGGVYRL